MGGRGGRHETAKLSHFNQYFLDPLIVWGTIIKTIPVGVVKLVSTDTTSCC